jgi:transposase
MKALSMDLRERVAKAKGPGSSYEVAARFAVCDSWVRKIWIRMTATGSVAPLPRGGNRARKVDQEGEVLIRRWVGEQPDLTIDEIRARYLVERHVAVSEPAMRRAVNRLGLSRKKRRSSRPSVKANESSRRATSTSRSGSVGSAGG